MQNKTTKMGRPALFTSRKTMSFDVDEVMYDEIEKFAEQLGVKKSSVIRLALSKFIEGGLDETRRQDVND